MTIDGQQIDETDELTWKYTSEYRELRVYTEDESFIGAHDIEITAYLVDYPNVKSQVVQTMLRVFDVCPGANQITSPGQTNPNDYYYTSDAPSMEFTLNPFTADPASCSSNIAYTCEVILGPRTDLCSVATGSTEGVFNPVTGSFNFVTFDMENFPPGAYTFRITGQIDDKSAATTFTVNFVDPCPSTTLTLTPDVFQDETYFLRTPQ